MDALFYVDALPGVGGLVVVDGDEGFHAATVRRLRVGERVVLGDGDGELADCEVAETGKRELTATVLARRTANRPRPAVTVVQAIPKAERSELAIELATEAGADAFVAWQAARCVARWEGPKADKGLRRWRAVARSAARQSRRAFIPGVDGVIGTPQLLDRVAARACPGPARIGDRAVHRPRSRGRGVDNRGGRSGGRHHRRRDRRADDGRRACGAAWADGAADVNGGRRRTRRARGVDAALVLIPTLSRRLRHPVGRPVPPGDHR